MSRGKGFRRPKKAGSGAVRASRLDDTLDAMNEETAKKMARALGDYHVEFVEPRLQWLEMPWYKKLFAKAAKAWRVLRHLLRRRPKAVKKPEPTPDIQPL